MRIQVGKSEKDWVDQVWSWVHTEIQPNARVFLPAGNTPLAAYKKWCLNPTAHLKSLHFVQIDDILSGPQCGTFKQFFKAELAPFVNQIEWIESANQEADVAILGVGLNGHVAFHEPSLPKTFPSGCVSLSEETKQYLHLPEKTWGVTYGVASFLKCRKILVLARGEKKKQILKQALKDKNLPIAWILEHKDVTLISDFDL